ncbi:MAG: hypothetical protein KIS66_06375 [Fimbriimonadaceae bacterium]|nr:hypothetical protein [Fimbriimonadaceae bacterium]
MNALLDDALVSLAARRPGFHSEADFQFDLAWRHRILRQDIEAASKCPCPALRERRSSTCSSATAPPEPRSRSSTGKCPLAVTHGGEDYRLKDAVAHDINRYDFVKDLQRTEELLAIGHVDQAYALALTNQPKYWEPRFARGRVDEAFRIEEGELVQGELAWAPNTGGTAKGREAPIVLKRAYRMAWRDFSHLPNERFGRFRALVVRAER